MRSTPTSAPIFELAGGDRLGVRSARAVAAGEDAGPPGTARAAEDGEPHLAAPTGELAIAELQPPGKRRDDRRRLAPRPRSLPSWRAAPVERADAGPARRLRGPAPRLRARRLGGPGAALSAAGRYELEGRERAQAQRLAYGSVQRRGTTDYLIAASPSGGSSASTRRCSRRCGSAPSSCSSPTAPPSTPPSTRPSSSPRVAATAAGAIAAPGSSTRSCGGSHARAQAILAALDPASAEGAAVIHSLPAWITELWIRRARPGGGARR